MTRPLYRTRNVIAAVDAVRDRHVWARQPMRLKHVMTLLAQERIRVVHASMRKRAFIIGADGIFVVTVRRGLNPEARTKVLLHEYGHAQMHFPERGEVVRQLVPCTSGDPRELEADLFAALLWFGPTATPDDPAIAKLVARLEGAVHLENAPQQLQLQMPPERPDPAPAKRAHGKPFPAPHPADREPQFAHLREIFDDLSRPIAERRKAWLEHVARQPKRLFRAITHDEMLFDWTRQGKPLRYFHLQLGWIEVYDGRRIELADGKHRWEILKAGDRRAERRTFVISTDDRRRYDFKKRETRGRAPKEIDAQIDKATRAKPRARPDSSPIPTPQPAEE